MKALTYRADALGVDPGRGLISRRLHPRGPGAERAAGMGQIDSRWESEIRTRVPAPGAVSTSSTASSP